MHVTAQFSSQARQNMFSFHRRLQVIIIVQSNDRQWLLLTWSVFFDHQPTDVKVDAVASRLLRDEAEGRFLSLSSEQT